MTLTLTLSLPLADAAAAPPAGMSSLSQVIPFVLVGVNGDDDRQQARSGSAKRGINWRSFWDGGSHGATPTKWGVQSWPTSYLVDPKGVIRDANLRGPDLDKAVEALVKEAEALAKKP